MKTIKLKSIFALILFSILTFGLASIATSAGTNISNNGFEDSFPKTAGGYVVWQGKDGNDWEIFLYNANDGSGPFQITDNDYGDVNPETDGRYVTWASGAAPYGEIFLYDIETGGTKRLTEIWDTDPTIMNRKYDHDPKIVDGVVVWVSHSEGVDTMYGSGDIMRYNAAYGSYENISKQIDPNNEHDDYAFRFDGNRIQWVQKPSTDMLNWVTVGVDNLENMIWEQVLNKNMRNYVYDLTTNKYFRHYIPDDGDLDFDAEYYVEDLTAGGAPYLETKSMAVLVDPQSDGDFSVNAMWINGDREILLMDRQNKRGGFLTNNDIKDIQPAIKDNIVVWTGGEGNNSEIYLYKINSNPLAEAGDNQVSECTDNVIKTASVTLDGSASTDPDGDLLSYIWEGPFDTITTDSPYTDVALPLGSHIIALTVDDSNGGVDSDNVNITVQDTTVPDIVISGIEDDSTYALGLVPTAGYLASDTCSGVSSSSGELTGGDSIGLGMFTYSVTAVDYADNVASATVSYKVIATTQGTAALIDQFISSGDISDPGKLYDFLSDAQGYIDSDNAKASHALRQFKNNLEWLKEKGKVSVAAKVVLKGAADAMIDELKGN